MQRPLSPALWVAILIACAGMVHAQTIIVGQPQLNFAAATGANSTVLTLPVQVTGGTSIPYIISFTPSSGGNWLYLSPSFGNLPQNVLLMASAATLGPGTYTGILTITAPAANNSPVNLPVIFSVGQSTIGTLNVSPSSLTFTGQVNGPSPLAQTVTVNTFSTAYSFNAAASTSNGVGWLQVTPTNGSTPSTLTVTVGSQGLAAGYHYGAITITPSYGPVVTVPVTLVLTTSNTVSFSTSSLQFYYQVGAATPGPQTFTVNGDTATPISFSLAPTTSVGNWLSVTPVVSVAPQTVTVSVNPSGLTPGTYFGNIAVSAGAVPTAIQNIAVTFTISTGTLLTVGTPPAPFNYTTGGTLPTAQSVQLDSTGPFLPYTVTTATTTGTNWLVVGPVASNTPQNLTVGVNPAGLAAGTYSGIVTVTSPNAVNSPQSFPVTLNVNTVQTLTAAPSSMTFNYQVGSNLTPTTQSLQVTTAVPTAVNAAATTASCGNWLHISSNTISAPTNLNVSVDPTIVATPQICYGTIVLSLGTTLSVQVPVTLNISTSPLLNISPASLSFVVDYNTDFGSTQSIALTSTDSTSLTFLASTGLNTAWLYATPSLGHTPANVLVGVNTTNLQPGRYTGNVTITSSGLATPQPVPVTLTVKAATTTVARPAALAFTQAIGGTTPAPQQLNISTTNGDFRFTATPSTSGGLGWLRVSPAGGSTPGTITVTAAGAGFGVGTYNGTINISVPGAANDPLVVPVTLTITAGVGITANPPSLTFIHQLGAPANPADQLISVAATGGTVISFTSSGTVTPGFGNWLTVKPASGSTPNTVTVSVNPSGLAVGSYSGQVGIASPGAIGSPILIPVTFTVQPQPAPFLDTVTNAASGASGAIAPGEIVTLKGSVLGPTTSATGTITNGRVDTALASSRVWFDTFAAPMLFTSRGQINTIVPYEIAGRPTVQVTVEYQGLRSPAVTLSTIQAAPGIFTANSTGTGQASVLNQDSTINSVTNPAAPETILQVFATGEGQTIPGGTTGLMAVSVFPKPIATVTATVDGVPAEVQYAGAAPGAVAGLLQVNVKLPPGITGDAVKLVIAVAGIPSQDNTTVAVR